jgi:dTDP-4-dehydrorhamnose reductase
MDSSFTSPWTVAREDYAGREFITPEYLDSMIKEVVNENGKIRLDELSNLLNVSTGVVERRLEELVKKKQLSNVSGTYISPTYIDRLAEQISDELQATNELKIVDVSLKFELPFDFLQSVGYSLTQGTLCQSRQANQWAAIGRWKKLVYRWTSRSSQGKIERYIPMPSHTENVELCLQDL